jgi:hypothetical protein
LHHVDSRSELGGAGQNKLGGPSGAADLSSMEMTQGLLIGGHCFN